MASAYVDAMREVQPCGPYALAGYSFGGLVAYEMACRLREMGEALDLLALFETDVSSRNLLPKERLLSKWALARRNMRELAAQPPQRWLSFLLEKVAVVWRRVVWRRDFIRELDDPALDLSDTVRARNRQLYEIGAREFAAYQPRHYSGTLSIFRTAHSSDPLLFWRRAADRVDVCNIAGRHGTIMDDPNVTSLAARLRLYLDRRDLERAACVFEASVDPDRSAVLAPPLAKIADPAT
jgi:acetoacetyl-CoA synthetase